MRTSWHRGTVYHMFDRLAAGFTTSTGIAVPPSALSWIFTRSGGPGGQHVNSTESRATLVVDLRQVSGPPAALAQLRGSLGGELRVSSDTERSQLQNRRRCIKIAAARLEAASEVPVPRRQTRPKPGVLQRRRASREATSKQKRLRRPVRDW